MTILTEATIDEIQSAINDRLTSITSLRAYATEPDKPKSPGGGIKDEKPIAAEGVKADFVLPKDAKVKKILVATPEEPDGVEVKFEVKDGRVKFDVPKFLVYAIARVIL